MKLLTQELIEQLPKLYEQDEKRGNAIIYIKYFTPDSSLTWYVLEGEKVQNDFEFFGIVNNGEIQEYGYFRLSELQKVRGGLDLPIERDLHFKNSKVSDVRELKSLWS